MLSSLLGRIVPWLLSRLSFPEQRSDLVNGDLMTHFEQGILNGIRQAPGDEVLADQARVPWSYRDFYREGYALGLAAIHACRFARGNPDRRHALADFRIMHFTGYGFYVAIAEQYRLPRISLTADRWRGVPDYDRFHPFLTGGYTFGKTAFAPELDARFFRRFEDPAPYPAHAQAAWHGCGRALWFRFTHNLPRLIETLEAYPPARRHLTYGLGMAMTFTQIAEPRQVNADIESFPPEYRELLRRGAGTALAGMLKDHPASATEVHRLYPGELGTYLARGMAAGEAAASAGGDWYPTYFALLDAACDADAATAEAADLAESA